MLGKFACFYLGLLRVSEYSDIHGSAYKIEYEYSSLPKSLDRDLFFFFFFFTFFVSETRSFSQNGPLKFFTMTTVLILFKYLCFLLVSDILYR